MWQVQFRSGFKQPFKCYGPYKTQAQARWQMKRLWAKHFDQNGKYGVISPVRQEEEEN